MHRRAYFIYALSAVIAFCAGNAALGQEPALIINKDGLSPELQLGDVVQGTVSKDGASIVVGDKAYPRGYVALKRNGCFEVGVQQGLDSGILKESTPIHRQGYG